MVTNTFSSNAVFSCAGMKIFYYKLTNIIHKLPCSCVKVRWHVPQASDEKWQLFFKFQQPDNVPNNISTIQVYFQ